ncbi:protein NRT1/ PTR FAMILY 4.5-like [Humulus lupulus]|uniref:protein NRT1/ PTR FAMILY 4.5-like n=1 Tax=Humulus lupulus TaxID=3486 RepID=UPI002B4024C8|nr:protein NRT1/ PTR FAMILY 4.5-like [Humulus lupulus]
MMKAECVDGKVDWKGRTALKYKHGGLRASLLILGTFGLENVATLALSVNLITYFVAILHFKVADGANHLTNFMGTSYILSILMAILADTLIGRFKITVISACLEFMGLVLLTIQARKPELRPPPCNLADPTATCEELSGGNKALLFVGLYMLACGSGGVKAGLPAHGADQFEEKDPKEAKQMSSFFNSLLLALCLGGAISLTLLVWIQDNKGWDWGFGVSTIAVFLSIFVFVSGMPTYRFQTIQANNAMVQIIQVYVAAVRNRNLSLSEDPSDLYEINQDKEAALEADFLPHTNAFRCLDKAAIIQENTTSPWRLSRVTQVENAKTLLGMLPIFGCTIIMTLCLAQLQTFSIGQAQTMDRSVISSSFKIPPASLAILPVIFLIIIIPIYDRLAMPFLRRLTGVPTGITHLQRIGVGLILSAISMAVAAILEVKRKAVARDNGLLEAIPQVQALPISIFWLSFQYFIFGIADMFTYVGLLEFFYSEAPKALKSFSTCFLWTSMALGYFCSTVLVKIVNSATKGSTRSGGWLAGNNININHLNLFYWLLSIMSLINFSIYLFVAKRYKYRVQLNTSPTNENEQKSKVYSDEQKN